MSIRTAFAALPDPRRGDARRRNPLDTPTNARTAPSRGAETWADFAAFGRAVRAQRAIENSLHRVLDAGSDERPARNRRDHGPENPAAPRNLALNVLQAARPGICIRRERKRSGWSDGSARSVIGQMR